MACIITMLLFGLGYSYLYYFLSDSLKLLPLWIFLGLLTSIVVFAIFVLIVILVCPWSKPTSKLKHFVVRKIVKLVHIILKIRIEVDGKENIPNSTFVVFGNHKSMLDITILYQIYNTVISAVAKKDLLKVPVLSRLMRGLGVTALDRENDREGVKDLLNAIKKVKSGLNYIIFPEGGVKTREKETMVSLRAGAYKLATKADAVISPVSIIGTSTISKNTPKRRVHVKIIIHRPIYPCEYNTLNTQELGLKVGTIVNNGVLHGIKNNKPLDEIDIVDFREAEYE